MPHIPSKDWIRALDTCETLNCVLGSDATYDDDAQLLTVSLGKIEDAIQKSLKTMESLDPEPRMESARVDRDISLLPFQQLQLEQIEADYIENFAAAKGNAEAQRKAYQLRMKLLRIFREQVVAPYAKGDINGFTVVYGPLDISGIFPRPLVRLRPDSLPITADTLIHFRQPRNSTEQHWREQKISARSVIRYFVEGVDDAARAALENPRTTIDAGVLRGLILG